MKNLIDGFKSVELEERLEMVHLTALAEKEDPGVCGPFSNVQTVDDIIE
jgi:hypothetical protein